MAIKEFKLPDVGEGVAEGELVSWLVEPGDTVSEDQPVAEVETDKAMVEVPSPYNGTVKELRAEEGDVVPVGEVIITFEVDDEEAAEGDAAEAQDRTGQADAEQGTEAPTGEETAAEDREPTTETETETEAESEAAVESGRVFAPPSARRRARKLGVDIGSVDGSGPGGRVTDADVRDAAESGGGPTGDGSATGGDGAGPRDVSFGGESAVTERGAPAEGEAETEPEAGTGTAAGAEAGEVEPAGRERTLAAPATRRIAEEEGVDINDVPTEETRDGEAFVTPEAVRAYAEAQRAAQRADAEAVSAGGAAETGGAEEAAAAAGGARAEEGLSGERVPYRGVRRTIGQQMQRSKFTAPHVTHHDEIVVEDLVEFREEYKELAAERDAKLTYMPFVMKAVVAALKRFPYVNAQLDEGNEEIVLRDEYNIGVAAATDAGLMVPVVEHADRKGLLELAREANEKVSRARDRSITREEMRDGTFTITNYGSIGGEYATPIINYPEVAILGLGELKERPVAEDGEVVARHTLPISLSVDHRIVDGAVAAEFANAVAEYLSNPKLLLLE